jgi:IS30 family transposase
MYRHISTDDRAVIASMLRHGYTKADIAGTLGFHRSSIGREVKEKSDPFHGYRAWYARHETEQRRRTSKRSYRTIESNAVLSKRIQSLLEPLVSPEVVAHMVGIHHQTIYTWVYRTRPDLIPMLPYHGKKRRRYAQKREKYSGWTKSVHSIDERVEEKLSWE